MEMLQRSYVTAVAAASGCTLVDPNIDEGVDVELRHRSSEHALNDRVARLEIQMKSTSSASRTHDDRVSATLSADNFEYFSSNDPPVDKIIVIMVQPSEQAHWIFARDRSLSIHRAAYWVNIAGMPTSGGRTVTISAPTTQLFDDLALCAMMRRIGQRGRP